MGEKDKVNPISMQSKKWIAEALLRLLKNKSYHHITITEIADEAQLARRTFYRNFQSKNDILYFYIEDLYHEYVALLKKQNELTMFHVAKVYFTFWRRHQEFLILLMKNDLFFLLLQKYNDYLPVIHQMFQENDEAKQQSEQFLTYGLAFSAGGFWNVLLSWIENGAREEPEQLAEIVGKMIQRI
ncbi:TetR/AcrR family transcriptional regulator [Paenibacillus caui]|uniref:TetR/AcrR family transcriptional regulator n=1 Tax=Paenibacillus caui TaxID=2873927 RepID=UPI001CAA2BEA|nr:TetR/AcrR family transcriptional regulator [Paenibacillus caui]